MCSAVSIMGAVQVLQEVFGLLSSTLTEAKDFIAKCHFGISLAITLPVMLLSLGCTSCQVFKEGVQN